MRPEPDYPLTGMDIEVVYARPKRCERIALKLPEGSCVRDAIEASGILARCPELTIGTANRVGIHARLVEPDAPLRHRDRIEIYRALLADPKAARQRRQKTV